VLDLYGTATAGADALMRMAHCSKAMIIERQSAPLRPNEHESNQPTFAKGELLFN
jgi:hypothetical protein